MGNEIYLKIIFSTNHKHVCVEKPICAFVYDLNSDAISYYNFEHEDVLINCEFSKFKKVIKNKKIFVINKKRYKYFLNGYDLHDVNVIKFIQDASILEFENPSLNYVPSNINDYNLIVPYVLHQESFLNEIEHIKRINLFEYDVFSYKFFNDFLSDILFNIEKNGLKLDLNHFNDFLKKSRKLEYIYTEYNIFNNTGRPTNRFDNINFSALNKNDGIRKSFVSRYENGYYLTVDYTAFHPSIVADLIGYQITECDSIYEYLAKKYFNINSVTDADIKRSKKLTMINLYGEIKDEFLNIDFFEKTERLKLKYWNSFCKHGFIRTPIYKRKITTDNIKDANKNKLFAYLIQSLETEYAINALDKCIQFVSNKSIKPILYVYDSIVFDVDSNCKKSEIIDLLNIFKNKKFKIKTYIGKNYHEMKQILI